MEYINEDNYVEHALKHMQKAQEISIEFGNQGLLYFIDYSIFILKDSVHAIKEVQKRENHGAS